MRWLSFLVVVAACGLASCRLVGTSGPREGLHRADDPAIRLSGRWDTSDPARPRASWPGFSVTTGFTGTSIAARMDDAGNYYNVEIDGKPHAVVRGGSSGEGTIMLAEGLEPGAHQLRLSRRNITFDRPSRLAGFILDEGGRLLPAARSRRLKFEFIGDSFTAAEGNEATAATLPWTKKFRVTNADQGFAAMIARAYDADPVLVCRSGSGVLCDWLGNRTAPMTERYGWTLMEQASPAWKFDDPAPDLVVICLGINDHTGLRRADGTISDDDAAAFRAAYRRLIGKVRRHRPRAQVVALAAYLPWVRDQVREVVHMERSDGDGRVHYAEFDEFPGGYVADGHPTVATHRRMAAQILRQLEPLALGNPQGFTLP